MQGKTDNILLTQKRNSNYKIKEAILWCIENPKKLSEKMIWLVTYIILFDLVFVFIFPFLYMIVTSLKTNADLNDLTVNWVPRTLKYQNYYIAFRSLGYVKFAQNSVLVTVLSTLGHLLTCSFVGYGFARYTFPGKKVFFFLVIVALIVPVQTLIIPTYMLFSNLHWLNTYLPLIVPTFFGFGLKGALFIFIFRQFYLGLPKELENAAKIDGCGFLRTYWSIVLPVAQSVFLVTIVLSLVWHWNDFYEPSIYASKSSLTLLPSRLNALVNLVNKPPEDIFNSIELGEGENTIDNAVLMAGTFLVVLPVILCFSFLQKKFMQGIERTGLTGE